MPVLRRPHRVRPLLDSIEAATPESHRVLFVASPGDRDEIAALRQAAAEWIVLDRPPGRGDYQRKINAGVRATTEPLIFTGADDLAFHPGWLASAVARLSPGIGVVGTNDLGNRRVMAGEHATHSLVTRAYVEQFGTIDEPGKLLHEGYDHNYCDTEMVDTAKTRGAWVFVADSVVEHLHPHWGKGEDDEVYRRGQRGFRNDRRRYHRRRRLWT